MQNHIARREEGLLPIGVAALVRTGHERIPYMIAAPTMLGPEAIPASNAFYAMAAVLNCATRNTHIVTDVYCPGLGTMIGKLSPVDASTEMAHAYSKWLGAIR